jgi:hypothetical protein
MMAIPFVAVEGQCFPTFEDWVNTASLSLTSHPDYLNTETDGFKKGWRGHHFTATCFDQKGRRCKSGSDFMLARDEGAFPVWWVWPDQIAELIMMPKP